MNCLALQSEQGEQLLDFLQRFPAPTEWSAPLIDGNRDIKSSFDACLTRITPIEVEEFRNMLGEFYAGRRTQDELRKEYFFRKLDIELTLRRVDCFKSGEDSALVATHIGTPTDTDGLLPLRLFDIQQNHLELDSLVYHLAPSLPQTNSTYWLGLLLMRRFRHNAKIRIDPFWIVPAKEYLQPMFKMQAYGLELDWDRIASLKQEEHLRFIVDPGTRQDGVVWASEIVWSPRNGYIHFLAEEIPSENRSDLRGGRYMHGIFDPSFGRFIHLDGAIRYYEKDELLLRQETHVRKSGKIGKRIKLFRIDDDLTTQDWSDLMGCFYVWNDDILEYSGTSPDAQSA
jgi:hypothetical protein